jgi:hypothetical protein
MTSNYRKIMISSHKLNQVEATKQLPRLRLTQIILGRKLAINLVSYTVYW